MSTSPLNSRAGLKGGVKYYLWAFEGLNLGPTRCPAQSGRTPIRTEDLRSVNATL